MLPLAEQGFTLTANGDYAHLTTGNKNLDLFASMGSLRGQTDNIQSLFAEAYREDPLVAVAQLLYLRDIRGGMGERDSFRSAFLSLSEANPEQAKAFSTLLEAIPELGRWDDLVHILVNTSQEQIQATAQELIRTQWKADLDAKNPSLLAKWLPSPNATSEKTRKQAKIVRKTLGLREKPYRQALTLIRSRLNLVENNLRVQDFEPIEYSHVPSRAMQKYRKVFGRKDWASYRTYLDSLASGEKEAKVDGLFPHEIIKPYLARSYWNRVIRPSEDEERLLEAQWESMKNTLLPEDAPLTLPVADVSGSMFMSKSKPWPIQVCLALTLLMSEQLPGELKNTYGIFSNEARLNKVKGSSLYQKLNHILKDDDIAHSTNMDAVFNLVFDWNQANPERPLERIVLVSDMQFNGGMIGGTSYNRARKRFKEADVFFPLIVFWNVNAKTGFPAKQSDKVLLVSGFSRPVMVDVLRGEEFSPVAHMLDVLMRYAPIAERFMQNMTR